MSGFAVDPQFNPRFMDNRDPVPLVVFEFYTKAKEDKEAARTAGHVVYRDVDCARWWKRGSNQSATECEIARLPKFYPHIWTQARPAYEAWKQGQEPPIEGTALKLWPMVSPAQVQNLALINIRTVEELAETTDSDFQRIGPGARDLREKARAWLKVARETGRITAELVSRDEQIAELQAALAAQREEMADLRRALDHVRPRSRKGDAE